MSLIRNIKTALSILLTITLLLLCTACDLSGETGRSTISVRPDESEAKYSSQTINDSMSEEKPESVSRTESNTDNASDAAILNPETPGMTSSQENEFIEVGNEWQELFDSATAMESYLRSVLSDSDHGGISVFTGTWGDTIDDAVNDTDAGMPRLIIHVINKDAFNKAIQSYTGKRCKFIIEDGKWSLEDMNNFAEVLKSIKLEPKETLLVYTSEESNCIAANISKEGEDRLKNEISALMNNYSIPDDCVWIWTLGGAGENPVT